jgi:hypothetical protein
MRNPFVITEMPLAARFHRDFAWFVTAPFRERNVHCGECATYVEAAKRAEALYRRMLARPKRPLICHVPRSLSVKAANKAAMLSRLAAMRAKQHKD